MTITIEQEECIVDIHNMATLTSEILHPTLAHLDPYT